MTDPDEITADNAGIPDPELPDGAVLQALAEFLELAAEGQNLPPGLNVRAEGNIVEILSRGEVIAVLSHAELMERAGIIAATRN